MNKNLKFIQKFFLITAPILASSVLAISPSKAATFALSESTVEFDNFNQIPSDVAAITDTDTLTDGEGAIVQAFADANAEFLETPTVANNSNFSLAFGENQTYSATAESTSEIIGNFNIEADTNFSFDFAADLNLETSIDNPAAENAQANGDIFFLLLDIDNQTVLDFFNLTGNVSTKSENDSVELETSENINVTSQKFDTDFGGLEESLEASVEGSFERYFANETNLALVEVTRNQVKVRAPEPSISLTLLVSSGVIGVILKRRRKSA